MCVKLISHNYLVSGSLRSNLDPFNLHDDATLWDALKRSYLVPSEAGTKRDSVVTLAGSSGGGGDGGGGGSGRNNGTKTSTANQFTLDSMIEDEGSNLSIGQVCTDQSQSPPSLSPSSCLRGWMVYLAIVGFPCSCISEER